MSGPVNSLWQFDAEKDVIYNHILNDLDEVPVFSRESIITEQPHQLGECNSEIGQNILPLPGIQLLEDLEKVQIEQTLELSDLFSIIESETTFLVKGDYESVVLAGMENSSPWQRAIFGTSRRFVLRLFDTSTKESLFCIRRLAPSNPLFSFYLQRMDVFLPPCEYLGCIQQQWTPSCTTLSIRNYNNEDILSVVGPAICCSCLFQRDFIFEINFSETTVEIKFNIRPALSHFYRKCGKYCLIRNPGSTEAISSIIRQREDHNRLLVNFPSVDYNKKALILACAFLITDEKYAGNFERDTYNGDGAYKCHGISDESWTYEGKFLANRKEGFGILSYGDGSMFCGLYREDVQFGPGVFTYPDQFQDVGLWKGSRIVRLCVTVVTLEKLGTSLQNKLRMAAFKRLVPIETEPQDVAKQIMKGVTDDEDLIRNSDLLYSRYCKNPRSIFFDKKLFQRPFMEDLINIEDTLVEGWDKKSSESTPSSKVMYDVQEKDSLIDLSILRLKRSTSSHQKQERDGGAIAYLLAWNSNRRIINIMKHAFLHRNDKNNSCADLKSILCERKRQFRMAGLKEQASIDILLACHDNDPLSVIQLLRDYQLDLNLMDNNGNSLIITAAAFNARSVMELLFRLRVRINSLNDEGFSALTYCLTKYLAELYDVTDWPAAFLPPDRLEDHKGEVWMKCSEENFFSSTFLKKKISTKQDYLFDVNPKLLQEPPEEPSEGKKSKKIKRIEFNRKKEKVKKRGAKVAKTEVTASITQMSINLLDMPPEKLSRLKDIELTINLLIEMRIRLTASQVPTVPMVLALYSGNIQLIEKLLQNGTDPNEKIFNMNGNLTPLHILALIKPQYNFPDIAKLLLKYGADPHITTTPQFADLARQGLVKYYSDFEFQYKGLNPLQALCLRADAQVVEGRKQLEELCCVLAEFTDKNILFCGMNSLGLAIARDNYNLLPTLIECGGYDVNHNFDRHWGNAIALFFLFHGTSPERAAYRTLDVLLEHGANPLALIDLKMMPLVGNLFNFFEMYIDTILDVGSLYNESSIISEGQRKSIIDERINIFEGRGRARLRRHLRGFIAKKLLELGDLDRPVTKSKAMGVFTDLYNLIEFARDWMDNKEFADILQLMAKAQVVVLPNEDVLREVLDSLPYKYVYVKTDKTLSIQPPSKKEAANWRKLGMTGDLLMLNLDPTLAEYQAVKQLISQGRLSHKDALKSISLKETPELDFRGSDYLVCFNCLKRSSKLQTCPRCDIVHFCSKKCNLEDIKNEQSEHKCNIIFHGMAPSDHFHMTSQAARKKSDFIMKHNESISETELMGEEQKILEPKYDLRYVSKKWKKLPPKLTKGKKEEVGEEAEDVSIKEQKYNLSSSTFGNYQDYLEALKSLSLKVSNTRTNRKKHRTKDKKHTAADIQDEDNRKAVEEFLTSKRSSVAREKLMETKRAVKFQSLRTHSLKQRIVGYGTGKRKDGEAAGKAGQRPRFKIKEHKIKGYKGLKPVNVTTLTGLKQVNVTTLTHFKPTRLKIGGGRAERLSGRRMSKQKLHWRSKMGKGEVMVTSVKLKEKKFWRSMARSSTTYINQRRLLDKLGELRTQKALAQWERMLQKKKEEREKATPEQVYQLFGLERPQVETYWEPEMEMSETSLAARFRALLHSLSSTFGPKFDLDKFLPYVVFKDGSLYYKFYGELGSKFQENYSYN